jgi:hypothetical protein
MQHITLARWVTVSAVNRQGSPHTLLDITELENSPPPSLGVHEYTVVQVEDLRI